MITVSILINGQPIYTRTAVNRTKGGGKPESKNSYELDDGSRIIHIPNKGAIKLAIEMLKTIKEIEALFENQFPDLFFKEGIKDKNAVKEFTVLSLLKLHQSMLDSLPEEKLSNSTNLSENVERIGYNQALREIKQKWG